MNDVAIKLIDVKKTINNKEIIKGLTFEINKGEVFGFIGPNGAGNTTTIRMMVGLMKLTDGDVIIQGHSINSDFKKAVREVGAIVENPEMYPFMTGTQNLKHYANMVPGIDRKSTRLNSSHVSISYAVFCLKKKIYKDQSETQIKPSARPPAGSCCSVSTWHPATTGTSTTP